MRAWRHFWSVGSRATCFGLVLVACARTERPAPASSEVRRDSTMPAPVTDTATHVVGPAVSQADTARGIVRRVGADPLTRLALFPSTGANATPLALAGAQQSELAAAEGLEVTVTGRRTAERAMEVAPGGAEVFQVRQFVVRAADGVEAHDGVLVNVDGRFFLETAPGTRVPVPNLPTALRTQVGARLFLVGPLGLPPHGFGVLRRP